MAQVDSIRGESTLARAVLCAFGAILWKLVRLSLYGILVICGPVLQIGLTTVAVLGVVAAIVVEFSGSAPRFPFWGAMLFFFCCGALPHLHRAALRLLAT
jgi:hypothetical protein